MTPIELFAVVTLAAFVALLGDRFIGAAVQVWSMHRFAKRLMRGVDAELRERAKTHTADRRAN